MSLINSMLQVDPLHRPSIYEIISHDWFKGEVPTQQEIVKEFQERHAMVRAELDAQKKEKEEKKERTYHKVRDEVTLDKANPM